MSENAASRWAGLRARGLEGGEMEAEGMRGRVRNVVAMREGGVRAMGGGALGVRGAARSGRGSHLSHGRPGREVEDGRLADDDTDKRGEEGMAGVADEKVLDDAYRRLGHALLLHLPRIPRTGG